MEDMDYGWELSTAVVLFHEAVARRLGLSAADHKALGYIAREGPLPIGALATAMSFRPSAATAMVDRLERAGYVRRVPDPGDRRRVLIEADPGRRPDLAAVFADLTADMESFIQRYDDRERAVITDFVTHTVEVLKRQTARLQ